MYPVSTIVLLDEPWAGDAMAITSRIKPLRVLVRVRKTGPGAACCIFRITWSGTISLGNAKDA